MTEEMLDLLLIIIDAKIAAQAAYDSSDGGLVEMVRARAIEDELRDLVRQANAGEE